MLDMGLLLGGNCLFNDLGQEIKVRNRVVVLEVSLWSVSFRRGGLAKACLMFKRVKTDAFMEEKDDNIGD